MALQINPKTLNVYDSQGNKMVIPAIQGESGVYVGSDTPPKGTKVRIDPTSTDEINVPEVLDNLGDSTTDTISQKKLTEILNTKVSQEDIGKFGTVFNYKGNKATYSALPNTGNKVGDVWTVTESNAEYVWIDQDGGKWEAFGPTIDLSGYLAKPSVPGTEGQFAVFNADGTIKGVTLENAAEVAL